jgi:hypothetical protein
MNGDLVKRWDSEPGRAFVETLSRLGRSGNGHEIREVPFGTVPETGRLDLRGLVLPTRTELRRITFQYADFTGAKFIHAKTELSVFRDVRFDDSSLRLGEGGSTFEKCSFHRTNLRRSVIGMRGSKFRDCKFEKADFIQTGFIRPEFDDCCFNNCTFSGVDFNGGSFERCEFRGDVRGVWFRGGFPIPSWNEEWGRPRPNRMLSVSFQKARLIDMTFSDHCDLSSVIPPDDGRHAVFDHWPERIKSVFEQSRSWPEPFRRAGEMFYTSCETHARSQNWFLDGVDALISLHGVEGGKKIWEALLSTQPPIPMAHTKA